MSCDEGIKQTKDGVVEMGPDPLEVDMRRRLKRCRGSTPSWFRTEAQELSNARDYAGTDFGMSGMIRASKMSQVQIAAGSGW